MITWIQVLLQKHHKVIFSILLFVIIIAFVFTVGSSIPFFGDRTAKSIKVSKFYGYNLEDPNVMQRFQLQAQFEAVMRGQKPEGKAIAMNVYRHAYLMAMAEKLGIRHISAAEFAEFGKSLPALYNADGSFNTNFAKDISKAYRMSEEDINNLLYTCAIINKVEKLLIGPGYVLEEETKLDFNQAYGKWNLELAKFDITKFAPAIALDEAKVKEFYEQNKAAFTVPAGAALDVAFIPASDFPETTKEFSDNEIQKQYNITMKKYMSEKDGKIADLADVKDSVIKDLKEASKLAAALAKAEDITIKIYNSGAKQNSPELKRILGETKLTLKSLPLVRPSDAKFPEGIPSEVFEQGFKLDSDTYFKDPIRTETGAWLVFLRETKDAYIPELSDCKVAVEAMYKAEEKRRLFSEFNTKTVENLKANAKDAASFKKLAEEAGFTVSGIENFFLMDENFRTQKYAQWSILYSELSKVKVGEASNAITLPSASYIIFASKFEDAKLDPNSESYKSLVENEKMTMQRMSLISIYNAKFGSFINALSNKE